jgi:hypothetical protein
MYIKKSEKNIISQKNHPTIKRVYSVKSVPMNAKSEVEK